MKNLTLVWSTLLVLVLLPSVSLATVWYIDGDVSSSGDGTNWAQAFKTIQEGVDTAANSDEVWVKRGTYLLSSQIYVDKAIGFYGGFNGTEIAKGQRDLITNVTTVNGNNSVNVFVIYGTDHLNATIDGFTITNSNDRGIIIHNPYSSTLSVNNCTLSNNGGDAIYAQPDIEEAGIDININNSTFSNNGGGISITPSPLVGNSISMINSTFFNNGGVIDSSDSDLSIVNSTFYNSGTIYVESTISVGSANVDINNSILWGTGISFGHNGSATVAYSNIEGGYTGTGNIDTDPLFVNAAGGDFRLKAGSPAIDSGTSSGAPSTDIDGNSRPSGSGYDMGAYESNNVFSSCTTQTEIPETECNALVALYDSTDGANWTDNATNNWKVTNTPCSWTGVTCSGGRVTSIVRSSKKLNGALPDLSSLTALEDLSLPYNQLNGPVSDLSTLMALQTLWLENNQLIGPIPDVSAMIDLQILSLGENQLTGNIPNLSAMTNLQVLRLGNNKLDGTIPSYLNDLTALQTIDLRLNQLTGNIPDLNKLTSLQKLNLAGNQLTGSIPDLSTLTALKTLWLTGNQLNGNIPSLSNLTKLQYLFLSDNQLSGNIPDVSALTDLLTFDLSSNQLSGSIPDLSSLINAGVILDSNQLSGIIPDLSNLTVGADFGYNQLTDETAGSATAKDSDWTDTQTVSPTNITATASSTDTIQIAWTPITYTSDGGYYQVKYATTSGGSYTVSGTTTNKSATSYDVTGLTAGTTYYFVVETFTPKHGVQQNDLTSAFSTEVTAATLSGDVCVVQTEISPEECNALVALYDNTDGDNWTDKATNNWKVTNTPCSWTGVTCSGGNVTMIGRSLANLNGTIPDLSALTKLQYFDLQNNQLTGTIPNLSALIELVEFDLQNNQLTGTIPDLSTLTKLQFLTLNGNQLTGTIPNFSTLPLLQRIWLNDNQLSGTIPDLSALTNLQILWLHNNQLTGTIPNLSALTLLEQIWLQNNQLTGTIPDLSALTLLEQLYFRSNQLTGTIPDLSALTLLQYFELQNNQLAGPIPDLSALTNLLTLALSNNQFCKDTNIDYGKWTTEVSGFPDCDATFTCNDVTEIPQAECEVLVALYDNNNGINWTDNATNNWKVTDTPCSWTGVTCGETTVIEIERTTQNLTGTIPDLSALTNLQRLYFNGNQLSGSIPNFSALINLQELYLTDNQLSGNIPTFSTLTNLRNLRLDNNQLSGSIPDLSALTSLVALYLNNNQLSGEIPVSLATLNDLTTLDLGYNKLIASDAGLINFLNDKDPDWAETQLLAGAIQFEFTNVNVIENIGTATLTVTRTNGSFGAISVQYTTVDNTAIAGNDYTTTSGTLNWEDGEIENKTFTVNITDDTDVEDNETLNLVLSNATGGATLGSQETAPLAIIDNDAPAGVLQFSQATQNVNENAGSATITVTRTEGSTGAISVNYATANGTAIAGNDYTAISSGTLNWEDGDTEAKTFTVSITDDSDFEESETLKLTLSNPTGGAIIGSQEITTLTIIDNDAPAGILQFSQASQNVNENAGSITITVTRTDGKDGAISVNYATANGTATAGNDYIAISSGTLNWEDGDTETKTITVNITDDSDFEESETLKLTLSNPTGGAIIGSQEITTLTIIDNDAPAGILQFSQASQNVNENAGSATITVTRIEGSTGAISVNYATANGTATAGSDYIATSGILNWEDGDTEAKTFTVSITDDSDFEGNETIIVNLTKPTGNATIGTQNSSTLTIIDDDDDNQAPILDEIGNITTATIGNQVKIIVRATDPDGDNLTFQLIEAPLGAYLNPANHEFTWTPTKIGTAKVTIKVTDDGGLSDTKTFNITVAVTAAIADLAITQTSSPDLVAVGDKLTYTLTVHNTGPNPASAITVVKTLPKEVDFVDAYGTNWLCAKAQQTVTCELNNLAIGITAEPITINVIVSKTVKKNTLATVTAASSDPNNANNTTNPDTTKVGYTLQTSVSATTRPDLLQPEAAKRVYLSDETVTLTATSKSCYKFDHWEGACEGEGPTCTLQMDGNQETTAHFQTPVLALDTSADNGKIAIAPAESQYQCGDKVTLTATPNQTEDVFCGWMGDIVGKQNPISLILNEDLNISAIFCSANTEAAALPTKIYAKPGQKILFRASDNEDDNFFWAATKGEIDANGITATYQTPNEEGVFYVWASNGTGFTWSLIDTTSTDIQVILRIEPEPLFLAPNEVKTVSVLGYRPDGTTVNLTAETVLHCENTAIAQVTQTGQVTAHNVGTTTLLANYHGLEAKTSITVSSATQLLKVEPDIFVLHEGSTIPIVVYAVNQSGTKIIYKNATFDIRDKKIATVNGNIVQGKRTGSTWLDVTAGEITLPIPVVTLYSPKLNITPSRATIERGETISFSITGGESPYQITGRDVQLERENTFIYQSTVTGTAELIVTDNLNNQARAEVKTVAPLTVTPQQATITPEGEVTLRANGGTGDYDWFINRGKLDKLTGNTVQYTAPTRTGLHTATVIDGMGNSQDVLILVGTELSLSQRQLFLTPGGKSQIRVLGGTPEYQVTVSGGEVKLTTANNATIIDYTAPKVAGSYTIDVQDSMAQTISATVQVALDLLITPLAGRLDVGEQLKLHAAGGFGQKRWVASKGTFDKIEGESVVWTAPQNFGTVFLYVSDMAGATATATVEVSTTGLAITPSVRHVYPNEEAEFTVTGGGSPYSWVVEAGDIGTGDSIDYTAPPRKGIYQVTVHDNTGKEAQAQANVYSTNLLASPRTLYIQPNEALNIAISGGTGDYILQASLGEVINNVEVAENEISVKTEYTAPSGYYGHDTIRIRDTAGNLATINVEIAKPTDIVSTYAGPDGRIDEVEMEQALQDYFVGQYWLQDRTVMFLIVEQFQLDGVVEGN